MQHYPSVGAGRRSRESEPRQHKVTVRRSDAELAAVTAAAGRAGLAPAADIARAGVDAAEHRAAPIAEVQREALIELIRAAELAYRVSVNLEQAVARPNATGAPARISARRWPTACRWSTASTRRLRPSSDS